MDEETFSRKLRALIKEIAGLPADQQKQLAPLVEETKQRHRQIKENSEKLTQLLSDIQIGLKYLLFDLGATRRERDHLRKMLKNQPPTEEEGPDKTMGEV